MKLNYNANYYKAASTFYVGDALISVLGICF